MARFNMVWLFVVLALQIVARELPTIQKPKHALYCSADSLAPTFEFEETCRDLTVSTKKYVVGTVCTKNIVNDDGAKCVNVSFQSTHEKVRLKRVKAAVYGHEIDGPGKNHLEVESRKQKRSVGRGCYKPHKSESSKKNRKVKSLNVQICPDEIPSDDGFCCDDQLNLMAYAVVDVDNRKTTKAMMEPNGEDDDCENFLLDRKWWWFDVAVCKMGLSCKSEEEETVTEESKVCECGAFATAYFDADGDCACCSSSANMCMSNGACVDVEEFGTALTDEGTAKIDFSGNCSICETNCTPAGVFSELSLPSSSSSEGECATLMELGDLLPKGVEAMLGNAGPIKTTISAVVEKIVDDITTMLDTFTGTSDVTDAAVCLGDFLGVDIAEAHDEGLGSTGCDVLPLGDDGTWSLMSFSIPNIPALCPLVDPLALVSMCVAFSMEDGVPSFALTMSSSTISCIAGNGAALASTAGLSSIVAKAAELGLDSVGVGMSLSNSFVQKADIFTKNGLTQVEMPGTYFDQVEIDIGADKFYLPDVFSLHGNFRRTVRVMADPSVFNELVSASSVEEAGQDILDFAASLGFSMLVTGELKYDLTLNEITYGVLPDLVDMEIGQFSAFMTTNETSLSDGSVAPAGIYLYAEDNSSILAQIINVGKALLEDIEGVLDELGWLADLGLPKASELLDNIDTGDSAGMKYGFLVNTEEVRLSITFKLGVSITVTAVYDFVHLKFGFNLEVDGLSQFFTAIIDAVADGIRWIISKAEDFFVAIADSPIGIAAIQTGEKIASFAKGAIDSSEEALTQCTEVLTKIAEDAIEDLIDFAEDVEDIANDFADGVEDAANDFADGVEDAANDFADGAEDVANDFVDVFDDIFR
ncbi:hypothetical protein NDN08_005010 [Rhodosorus marinus]|uniref:Uncharacterized protein n=1 Tax=Rhodosorus marinus TaxID=101924 RepID=A0AAV8UF91_9RHOD|nr:hypothetical protein NDN08_005010 [Rhodosorus marinus]